MFSSIFYIAILLVQLIYAESNFSYNQQIGKINMLVEEGEYLSAFRGIQNLEEKSIFTNNDLARMRRKLELKVHLKSENEHYEARTLNEYMIKTLSYFQNSQYERSLTYSKQIIVNDPIASDSMIKMFEIISAKAPNLSKYFKHSNQQKAAPKMHINEAMSLLDLMKRKEKTLF